jgi:hypothetical protein
MKTGEQVYISRNEPIERIIERSQQLYSPETGMYVIAYYAYSRGNWHEIFSDESSTKVVPLRS